MWKLIYCSVICVLYFKSELVDGERSVQFLAGNCTYNAKYFRNFSLTIEKNTMNMDMDLNRPIVRGFKVHVDVHMRLANAKNFQSVFSQVNDVCAATATVKNSLFKSWFKDMTKHGNFMYNCPVQLGHYYMHDWRMGSAMTHRFLIPGEYRGIVTFFYGKYKTKSYDEALTLMIDTILSN